AMMLGSLLLLPALLFVGLPARTTWIMLLISAAVEASYFIILPYAYEDADFSLVYPLARGAAPALIALWSVLFLKEQLTPGGVAGLITIILGLLVVGGSGWLLANGKPHWRGILPALLLALCISIYTVIDGAAVKMTSPLAYAALIYFVSSLYMTPFIVRRYGWTRLTQEFRLNGRRLLLIGILIQAAYFLALLAYRLSHVSYSGAIREVGVVMGAFAGWQFLGEKFGAARLIGAIVIFVGILMIALLG
ncbi:MAG TPA: DMT family transporter, partial [Anaerolineales bacterium]|nr:DMT family transporter [Anaerolineales bacterium]